MHDIYQEIQDPGSFHIDPPTSIIDISLPSSPSPLLLGIKNQDGAALTICRLIQIHIHIDLDLDLDLESIAGNHHSCILSSHRYRYRIGPQYIPQNLHRLID